MTEPVFSLHAYGELELGKASEHKPDATASHGTVDADKEEK